MADALFGKKSRKDTLHCAYGYLLLHVDPLHCYKILAERHRGHFSGKTGWVQLSVHPATTNGTDVFYPWE
jgi:hypothetical protein